MKRKRGSASPTPTQGRRTKRPAEARKTGKSSPQLSDGVGSVVNVTNEAGPAPKLASSKSSIAKGKSTIKDEKMSNDNADIVEISDSSQSPPPQMDQDDSDSVFHQGTSEIKTDPLVQDSSVPVPAGPITPNTNGLLKATDFDRVVMRDLHHRAYEVDNYIHFDKLRLHTSPEEVQFLQFSGIKTELGWSHGNIMTLFNTINAFKWLIAGRQVINPMFANPARAQLVGDYHNVCVDNQKLGYFGFVGIVTFSTITESGGKLAMGPLQCFGESFARYLARVKGEDHFGYRGEGGDVLINRPGFLKVYTTSPQKPGRMAPRTSEAPGIIYEVNSTTADGRYDFESARQMYGEPRRDSLVFVVVTANEFGPQKQYEGDFNLSVHKVFVLRKLM